MSDVGPEHVEERAKKLARGGEGHTGIEGDPEASDRAASAILEESEERVQDDAARDPLDDSVIRRDSDETAATGES